MGHLKSWGSAGTVTNLRNVHLNMKTSRDPKKTERKKSTPQGKKMKE